MTAANPDIWAVIVSKLFHSYAVASSEGRYNTEL